MLSQKREKTYFFLLIFPICMPSHMSEHFNSEQMFALQTPQAILTTPASQKPFLNYQYQKTTVEMF